MLPAPSLLPSSHLPSSLLPIIFSQSYTQVFTLPVALSLLYFHSRILAVAITQLHLNYQKSDPYVAFCLPLFPNNDVRLTAQIVVLLSVRGPWILGMRTSIMLKVLPLFRFAGPDFFQCNPSADVYELVFLFPVCSRGKTHQTLLLVVHA